MKYGSYDFAGWVTKNDVQCSDGVTIRHGAFAHQDGLKVPLVWEHKHDSPENVLGHVILEHRDEGVYGYVKTNSTPNGQNAKVQVHEGDITSFSIYANKVQKKASDVIHGMIREVSLVLSGANPGAMIIEHSDMSKQFQERCEVDGIIHHLDDFGGSQITEIYHNDSEGRSAVATPANAGNAEGSVPANSIGNLDADTQGRTSSNSIMFCTECGTARSGNFCGGCGADMRIDSRQQSQNTDQQNGMVQQSGFNPNESQVDTDHEDDSTVLAHEGAAGDGGSGESGAKGDGPKSDSDGYVELAQDLISEYGLPVESEDVYEYYLRCVSETYECDEEDEMDIQAIAEIFEEEWANNVEHSIRERARNVANRVGNTARSGVRRVARAAIDNTATGERVREVAVGAVSGRRNSARSIGQGVAIDARRAAGAAARGARATGGAVSERLQRWRERRAARGGNVRHSEDRTIDEVLNSLTDEQHAAVTFLMEQLQLNGSIAQSDLDSQAEILHTFDRDQQIATNVLLDLMDESIAQSGVTEDPKSNQNEGDETLKHNVFNSSQAATPTEGVLSHSERETIFNDIKSGRQGSMKTVLQHASITNIEVLFPNARNITTEPQVYKDRNRNANRIMDATNRVPWARVKTTIADFTEEEARARGYITGNQKVESIFKAVFRSTHPTTVYRKQHIDRDHVIDITDFDIIRFMNAQMRVLLIEELARAVLVGDGRADSHADKINEDNIRPILTDDDIWVTKIGGAEVQLDNLDELILLGMIHYQGSGEPVMFAHPAMTARIRTLRDKENRYMFPNLADYAARIGVSEIIPTTFMPVGKFIIGNLSDYTIGTDRGGEITTFEDFDIDFNLHKYLIETRISGAITTPKSFIAGEYADDFSPQVTPSLPVGPNLGN